MKSQLTQFAFPVEIQWLTIDFIDSTFKPFLNNRC